MVPAKLTPDFIESQIEFHRSGAEFYAEHDQRQMAEWSMTQAAYWQKKLGVCGEAEDRWE